MSIASSFSILAALASMAAVPMALAHGDAAHDKPAVRAKEQMPWGMAGSAKSAARAIEVRMTDKMRFTPDRIQVKQGETIRFMVRNEGKMLHEMVLGTREALNEHAALMERFPAMEHEAAYMTHVKPGESGRIVWNFNRPGEFQLACLVAGHYQAGMVGTITVSPSKESTRRKVKT